MIHTSARAALLLSSALLAFPALAENAAPEPESGPQTRTIITPAGPIMETQGEDILVTGDILQSSAINSVKTPTPITILVLFLEGYVSLAVR